MRLGQRMAGRAREDDRLGDQREDAQARVARDGEQGAVELTVGHHLDHPQCGLLRDDDLQALVGLAPFTAFAASAAAQIVFGSAAQRRLLVTGSWLFPVGLAVTAAALYHPTLGWFPTGAALAGVGAGLLFKAAAAQTVLAADPASRAGALAVFFIIAYAGMGLPSIAFSIVIRYAALAPTMVGFGAVLAVGTITALRARR